jgi:undecaprenyl diphosphate synthase
MFFFCKKNKLSIKQEDLPKHIAIIMDGNARWAKERRLPLQIGHKIGAQNIQKIVEDSIVLGIKFLTVYAFSSENWNRPTEEVEYLMNLLEEYLNNETKKLMEKNVKILISGNLLRLKDSARSRINEVEELTKDNKAITLNVAFSYGSRQEIIDAVKKIALAFKQDYISLEEIDEEFFRQNLYHPEVPNPDLLIRTAGDLRLSNFLLWQSAYTELYFTNTYWPSFSKKDLIQAINIFNKRERRYGKR